MMWPGLAPNLQAATDAPEASPEPAVETIEVTSRRLDIVAEGQQRVVIAPDDFPVLRIDAALASVPGVTLFRRADSLTANPTIQGVSLRGIGANAAGRVLVTLDGVPLNDPFGGWVYWSALAPEAIESVAVLKGGSAGAYGAQALAGTIALTSRPIGETSAYASAEYGSFDTTRFTAGGVLAGDGVGVRVDAMTFDTDGPFLIDEESRGPVDSRAASDADAVSLALEADLSETVKLFTSARYYREERDNGFELAVNDTEALDLSTRLLYAGADYDAELTLYYRSRDFSNIFVAALEGRTVERPVLDQFDVPGEGLGLLARVKWDQIEVGVDARRLSGGTNELFRNLGAGFTRLREASGDQWIIGSYIETYGETDRLSWSASLRGDAYRVFDGIRQEFDLENAGALLLDSPFEDRSGFLATGRLGGEARLTDAIRLSGAAYRSWRLPTINELYRPFRVVNDITEANADLEPEKLWGVEATLSYQPVTNFRASATVFRTWLEDGVGNITIGFGPGVFPVAGFVPAGGSLRQRDNIDLTITDGVELSAEAELGNGLSGYARYLFADVRISDFDANTALEGLTPPQTPRHSVTFGVRYALRGVSLAADGQFLSNAFNDDLNTQRLGSLFVVNVGVDVPISAGITLYGRVENLFDRRVVSNVSAFGLETLARPQFGRIGIRADF